LSGGQFIWLLSLVASPAWSDNIPAACLRLAHDEQPRPSWDDPHKKGHAEHALQLLSHDWAVGKLFSSVAVMLDGAASGLALWCHFALRTTAV
jgi:hypothetical protein